MDLTAEMAKFNILDSIKNEHAPQLMEPRDPSYRPKHFNFPSGAEACDPEPHLGTIEESKPGDAGLSSLPGNGTPPKEQPE